MYYWLTGHPKHPGQRVIALGRTASSTPNSLMSSPTASRLPPDLLTTRPPPRAHLRFLFLKKATKAPLHFGASRKRGFSARRPSSFSNGASAFVSLLVKESTYAVDRAVRGRTKPCPGGESLFRSLARESVGPRVLYDARRVRFLREAAPLLRTPYHRRRSKLVSNARNDCDPYTSRPRAERARGAGTSVRRRSTER
jgi:hypothetical protein